jgi:glutamine---fructose-6-phosphate transaminase (isomerizing)
VLPLAAGPEQAIAATKTYTAQVAALALLAGYTAEFGERIAEGIEHVTELISELLPGLEGRLSEVAVALAFVGRMFVIGRGPEFATAREISLKLLETCRVAAAPLTATDLAHGPVAALDGLFPVWTIASDDPLLPTVQEAAARAHAAGATLLVSGTGAAAIPDGDYYVPGWRCSRRCSRSSPARCSPGPWLGPRVSTQTGRTASPRSRSLPEQVMTTPAETSPRLPASLATSEGLDR